MSIVLSLLDKIVFEIEDKSIYRDYILHAKIIIYLHIDWNIICDIRFDKYIRYVCEL